MMNNLSEVKLRTKPNTLSLVIYFKRGPIFMDLFSVAVRNISRNRYYFSKANERGRDLIMWRRCILIVYRTYRSIVGITVYKQNDNRILITVASIKLTAPT